MAIFTVGARLHDYGKGTPDELFGKVSADGFACVQLAYKKCVPGVASYADVTPQLVQDTLEAQKKHNIAVAVLGTYVELAIADEVQRSANAADFKSQLAVCKALNAGCIGTETTGMHKQPAGTTRERAQYMLCKSLETILPEAERLGVTVAIEPVVGDSTNTPQAARHILDMMQSPALGVILDMSNLVSFEARTTSSPCGTPWVSCLGTKSRPYTLRARTLRRTAPCCTPAWKIPAPITPVPLPCCAPCRSRCPFCARKPCPPALPAILLLSNSFSKV